MSNCDLRIYHNARCSKSRSACALLAERGLQPTVVDYLAKPLDRATLEDLLGKLGLPASALLRRGEAAFKEHYGGRELTEGECLEALLAHPILLERPIVVLGDRAVVGRPPEKVLELLG